MDPFLEDHWHDVHHRLLNLISDQIGSQLPDDLVCQIEQAISLGESDSPKRADVDVSNWGDVSGWESDWNPGYDSYCGEGEVVAVAEPTVLVDSDLPHRFLGIRSAKTGRELVTVIEVLSPANKQGRNGREYSEKRSQYLNSRINFVEIDLLRVGGGPFGRISAQDEAGPPYLVFVRRCRLHPEVYPIEYGDRLPRFRVPLRPADLPAILDLQGAIDDCYRLGQFWKIIDYAAGSLKPKPSEAMGRWMSEVLEE